MDSGLAGLVAAETVLSHSDGARGILWVRGHTLADLAANFGYDGAVGLLWEGFAGENLGRERMRARLGAGRERAFARLADWLDQGEIAAPSGRRAGRPRPGVRHRRRPSPYGAWRAAGYSRDGGDGRGARHLFLRRHR